MHQACHPGLPSELVCDAPQQLLGSLVSSRAVGAVVFVFYFIFVLFLLLGLFWFFLLLFFFLAVMCNGVFYISQCLTLLMIAKVTLTSTPLCCSRWISDLIINHELVC